MIQTTAARSRNMAAIRGKNTRPELALRLALFAAGFRYRLHVRGIAGSPDLVFPKHRAVLFVHGCFWHRHTYCKFSTSPKANSEFWRLKFEQNVSRDTRNVILLRQQGWRVAVVWECALKRSVDEAVYTVSAWLTGQEPVLVVE